MMYILTAYLPPTEISTQNGHSVRQLTTYKIDNLTSVLDVVCGGDVKVRPIVEDRIGDIRVVFGVSERIIVQDLCWTRTIFTIEKTVE